VSQKNRSKKAAERHTKILQTLRRNGFVSVGNLSEALDVSDMTIRRDLDELQQMGILSRHHGGASLVRGRGDTEWPLMLREIEHLDEKKKIGEKAASLVQDGDVLIIDSGSTTLQMVEYLHQDRITVITNSLPHISKLSTMRNVNLIAVGGTYHPDNQCFLGSVSSDSFIKINANIAFMAASALSLSKGMTNRKIEEAEVKQAMIRAAEKKILLMDTSKIHCQTLATVGPLDIVDAFITDSGLSAEDKEAIEALGVEVILVGE